MRDDERSLQATHLAHRIRRKQVVHAASESIKEGRKKKDVKNLSFRPTYLTTSSVSTRFSPLFLIVSASPLSPPSLPPPPAPSSLSVSFSLLILSSLCQHIVDSRGPSFKKDVSSSSKPPTYPASEHYIQSKLVLLTLTFPRLRILWSSSPFQTTDIFSDLKAQQDEPNAEKAVLIGGGGGEGEDEEGGGGGGAELAAGELLRSIPGVVSDPHRVSWSSYPFFFLARTTDTLSFASLPSFAIFPPPSAFLSLVASTQSWPETSEREQLPTHHEPG